MNYNNIPAASRLYVESLNEMIKWTRPIVSWDMNLVHEWNANFDTMCREQRDLYMVGKWRLQTK